MRPYELRRLIAVCVVVAAVLIVFMSVSGEFHA